MDAFTDAHPEFQAARQLVSPARRRYGGILVDLCFDHYLARDWHEWADETLDDFVRRSLRRVSSQTGTMCPEPAKTHSHPHDGSRTGSVRTARCKGISAIMDRMAARRIKTAQPVPGGGGRSS